VEKKTIEEDIPTLPKKEKKTAFSENTKEILRKRKQAT